MGVIILFSSLLIGGIITSQIFDLAPFRPILSVLTTVALAYIMLDVGLEFTLDKTKIKSYGWDFCVAMMAALLPAVLWMAYFMCFFHSSGGNLMLLGLSAAPTSAGVLFTMLMAAGLGATWVFQKARVLAVFDDLGTILLLIPVQMLLVGLKPQLIVVIILLLALLFCAYRWLNRLHWPVGKGWLSLYSLGLVAGLIVLQHTTHVHLEVLLPAFVLGCVLYNPYHFQNPSKEGHSSHITYAWEGILDQSIKAVFMFLVGCSLPKVEMGDLSWGMAALHMLALLILSNMGKCFSLFCYRKEATLKERLALSIAMFPRGEVGAGVLLIAISYGFGGMALSLAVLSLALNLILTGAFVFWVLKLTKPSQQIPSNP